MVKVKAGSIYKFGGGFGSGDQSAGYFEVVWQRGSEVAVRRIGFNTIGDLVLGPTDGITDIWHSSHFTKARRVR